MKLPFSLRSPAIEKLTDRDPDPAPRIEAPRISPLKAILSSQGLSPVSNSTKTVMPTPTPAAPAAVSAPAAQEPSSFARPSIFTALPQEDNSNDTISGNLAATLAVAEDFPKMAMAIGKCFEGALPPPVLEKLGLMASPQKDPEEASIPPSLKDAREVKRLCSLMSDAVTLILENAKF